MSHCRACDAPLKKTMKMEMFEKDNDPPEDMVEDLCHVCRGHAREAYRLINSVPGDKQEAIYQHFFYSAHGEYYDSVVDRLIDGDTDITLQPEEM